MTAGGTAGSEVIGILIEPVNDLHWGQLPRTHQARRSWLVPLTAKFLNQIHAESETMSLKLDPLLLGQSQRLRETLGLANPLIKRHAHLHVSVLLYNELNYYDSLA